MAQVRVSFHHREGFVPKNFRYFRKACTVHGEVGRVAMPQIVPAEIENPRAL